MYLQIATASVCTSDQLSCILKEFDVSGGDNKKKKKISTFSSFLTCCKRTDSQTAGSHIA